MHFLHVGHMRNLIIFAVAIGLVNLDLCSLAVAIGPVSTGVM